MTKEETRERARLSQRKRRGKLLSDPWGGQKQDLGKQYEVLALSVLPTSTPTGKYHGSWDINWGKWRIDVKARNPAVGNVAGRYHFTRKKNSYATHFLCFCLKNDKIFRVYLFPAWFFGWSVEFLPDSGRRQNVVIEKLFRIEEFPIKFPQE